MAAGFKDHFSSLAQGYARYRPHYPRELFACLADLAPARAGAWDAATGNGQAAVGLAGHFAAVTATDGSAAQLAEAAPHPKITYRQMVSEDADFPDQSFDLVTVATAVHWFDLPRFYPVVKRVLRPRGVFAVWATSYERMDDPLIDALLRPMTRCLLEQYSHPEAALALSGYRDLPFPFAEVMVPMFTVSRERNLEDLLGYFDTWSSVQNYQKRHGVHPFDDLRLALRAAWGDPMKTRFQSWRVFMRAGRIEG